MQYSDVKDIRDFIKERQQKTGKTLNSFAFDVEWGGHWMVLIGYDDMGTKNFDDDVLIFADPYDTTDHFKDSYTKSPLNRAGFLLMEIFAKIV